MSKAGHFTHPASFNATSLLQSNRSLDSAKVETFSDSTKNCWPHFTTEPAGVNVKFNRAKVGKSSNGNEPLSVYALFYLYAFSIGYHRMRV